MTYSHNLSYTQYEVDSYLNKANKVVKISTGYTPRPYQALLHNNLKRFNVLVCHRRFGKTVFSIADMVDKGINNPLKNPQYAYIAPTYGQAKRVAWEYLKDFTKNIPGVRVHEQELRIDIPRPDKGDRIRFMLLGAENPDSLRGIYLDGVIMDEYAQCDPTVWSAVVRPALSDRKGWAIFIGTPKGQNHFHDLFQIARGKDNWFVTVIRASESNVIPYEELEEAKQTMSEEEYNQEYECSFTAAMIGSYYGKYMEEAEKQGRITNVPYDPNVPVETYWDLGISDTTAVWFIQIVGKEVHVIDYMEEAGRALDWYSKALKEKPYAYSNHYIPHDGAARELGTGKTRQETLLEHGIRTTIVPRQSVADGINAVRVTLPMCWFDRNKCAEGISALKNYQRKWDSKNKMFDDKPLHDWASNGADAFRQFGLMYNPERRSSSKRLEMYRMAETDYDAI